MRSRRANLRGKGRTPSSIRKRIDARITRETSPSRPSESTFNLGKETGKGRKSFPTALAVAVTRLQATPVVERQTLALANSAQVNVSSEPASESGHAWQRASARTAGRGLGDKSTSGLRICGVQMCRYSATSSEPQRHRTVSQSICPTALCGFQLFPVAEPRNFEDRSL